MKQIVLIFLCLLLILPMLYSCKETEPTAGDGSRPEGALLLDGEHETELENAEPVHVHSWLTADCQTPITCSDCGETVGAPLAHTWEEANYQEPQICLICGEIGEDVLTPGWMEFEDVPLVLELLENETNGENEMIAGEPQILLAWWLDNSPVGEIEVVDYRVFKYDEKFEAKEGYEYRVATFLLTFTDRSAFNHSTFQNFVLLDFYVLNIALDEAENRLYIDYGLLNYIEAQREEFPKSDIPGLMSGNFLLNYYGEEFEFFFLVTEDYEWDNRQGTRTVELTVLAPEGYEGLIVRFPGHLDRPFFRLRG